MINGERLIDTQSIVWTLTAMLLILVAYFLWRTVRMYYLEKRTAERARFYANYEPPRGQAAIDNRREFESLIEMDPDFANLSRSQRRALARQADLTMRKRAKAAKS